MYRYLILDKGKTLATFVTLYLEQKGKKRRGKDDKMTILSGKMVAAVTASFSTFLNPYIKTDRATK